MNYTLRNIKIKSNWFDDDGKFKKMGPEVFYLFLELFKFRLHNQENEHHCLTSIYHLRKETGFSKKDIFNYLKELQKVKVVKIENVPRWDRFLKADGSIPEKEILEITVTDLPETEKGIDEHSNTFDKPVSNEDYYISIDFGVVEAYITRRLHYKCLPVYCLMRRYQNGNREKKSYMAIEKMAKILGYDKDYLNKLIREMNRKYLLYSDYRINKQRGSGFLFEHHLLCTISEEVGFLRAFKEQIDKNTRKWDKKEQSK